MRMKQGEVMETKDGQKIMMHGDEVMPEFDSSKAHFRPTPSNGAGFRAMGRQKPRYTGC